VGDVLNDASMRRSAEGCPPAVTDRRMVLHERCAGRGSTYRPAPRNTNSGAS